jgi:serine/threonine protein kinase
MNSDNDRGGDKAPKQRVLLELAGAITDETPIQWDDQLSAHPALAARLRRLRLVEALHVAHRTTQAMYRNVGGAAALEAEEESSDELFPVLFTWGPLEVRELLGQGSSGEVYRAFDRRLEREVALKLRYPEARSDETSTLRCLNEARRLARVRHANVLAVHGAEIHDGRVGIWTDLVRGKTIEDRFTQDGPLGAEEAILIGLDLSRALAAVHAAGLVHGDVKAANVMRAEGGRIVLMDFGSVSERLEATTPKRRPQGAHGQRAVFGTPAAMAPELFEREPPSPASDLYALGVLLYRLTSGRYPVPASAVEELAEKHRRGERVPLRDVRSDLPAAFVQVVERALDPDPKARYTSAGAMETALLAAAPVPATGFRAGAPGLRLPRTRARALALAAALAMLIGLGAAVALWPRKGEIPAPSAPSVASPATAPQSPSPMSPDQMSPEVSPVAQAAVAPLQVEAALHRVRGGLEQELPSGAIIHPGEALFMTVEGTRPLHFYVLNEDAAGALFLLFPVPGLDLLNPLAPGVRHRLPGPRSGIAQDWQVTSAGGSEWVLAIAASEAIPALDRELAGFAPADPERGIVYPELRPESLEGLRGIGGMAESRSANARRSASRLADLARQLAGSKSETTWIRLFELHNPGL